MVWRRCAHTWTISGRASWRRSRLSSRSRKVRIMAEFRDSVDTAASPETVFEYLTTNSGLTAWMGQHADLDPTPGGRFAVDIAGYPVRGEFVHVEQPRRVVVSWGFLGSDDLPAGTST